MASLYQRVQEDFTMTERHDAKALAGAVREGRMTIEAALEEHLDGKTDQTEEDVIRTLAHHNMGWTERPVDIDDRTLTVAEFVKELDLAPFLPLLDRTEDFEYPLGDLVAFEDETFQVIGRRAVTGFAAPRFGDFELLIESLTRNMAGFVSEDEVEPVESDESDEQ
jgi:hypothetical protein